MLRKLLEEHIHVASEFLKMYESEDFLWEEVGKHEHRGKIPGGPIRDSGPPLESPMVMEPFDVSTLPGPGTWSAGRQLRGAIKELKKCSLRFNALDKDTETVIQLVSFITPCSGGECTRLNLVIIAIQSNIDIRNT